MSQILENIHEKPLKEKLHLMAETLRNHEDIKQCQLYKIDRNEKMCVYGLLAFRAGTPKNEIDELLYSEILSFYGITNKELETPITNLYFDKLDDVYKKTWSNSPYLKHLYWLNDAGLTFDEIADCIEYTADRL